MKICIPIIESETFTVNPNYKEIKYSLIIESNSYFLQVIDMTNWSYNQMIDYLYDVNVAYFMGNNILLEDEQNLASKRIIAYPLDLTINGLDNAVKLKQYIDENRRLEIRPQTYC